MLRELRRELLLEISGGEKRIGSSDEIKSWMLDKYQQNPLVADMFRAILLINEDLLLRENELPSLSKCKSAIIDVEKLPLPEFGFVSSFHEGRPAGALVQREALKVGGLVYSITLFDRENLTKRVSRVEIRASIIEPEPFASIFTLDGWVHFAKDEIHSETHIVFALQCLIALHRYNYPTLSIDSIVDNRVTKPRPNKYLEGLIAQAYLDNVVCYKVKVCLAQVTPRDVDYALTIPEEQIKSFIDQVAEFGYPFHDLLLYERNGGLIMDDDYIPYLAYRALKLEEVPAVIVGSFDQPNVKVLETGGRELIPPIVVTKVSAGQKRIRSKEYLLQEKLSHLTRTASIETKLENRFIHFCRLLSNASISEKELHNFLSRNSQILDSHAASMYSEVTIGRYRADLVLRYDQVDKRVILIELEKHSDKIFTKENRLRSKVTHASQQVEDWINEIRLGARKIPNWLNQEFCPEGAVVIGRTSDLTEEQKQTLATINANRLVKIITYDDLLTRMKQLIKSLRLSD
jgi:hypothetical protein